MSDLRVSDRQQSIFLTDGIKPIENIKKESKKGLKIRKHLKSHSKPLKGLKGKSFISDINNLPKSKIEKKIDSLKNSFSFALLEGNIEMAETFLEKLKSCSDNITSDLKFYLEKSSTGETVDLFNRVEKDCYLTEKTSKIDKKAILKTIEVLKRELFDTSKPSIEMKEKKLSSIHKIIEDLLRDGGSLDMIKIILIIERAKESAFLKIKELEPYIP